MNITVGSVDEYYEWSFCLSNYVFCLNYKYKKTNESYQKIGAEIEQWIKVWGFFGCACLKKCT